MHSLLSLVFATLLVFLPALAAAQKVLIWGIQDGCETLPEMDKILHKNLKKAAIDAELLFPAASNCEGAACAQLLRAGCGGSSAVQSGRLVGGRIYRTSQRTTSRFRLWMHDLATGGTAYSDTYCQDCNLIYSLPAQVDALLANPRVRPGVSATPLYCQDDAASHPNPPRIAIARYLLSVSGDSKIVKSVQAGLRPMMRQALLPVETIKDLRSTDSAELRKLVGPKRDSQILGVELPREGGATLWLYDGPSDKTQTASVDCPACEAQELLNKLDNPLTALLATCFDGNCANAGSRPYPPEACTPLVEPSCPAAPLPAAQPTPEARPLDNKTATAIQALSWSAFAATAGAALALAIANPLVTQDVNGHTYGGTLTRPAWALAGVSVGLLAVSIPITILVRGATNPSSGTASAGSHPPAPFQCPN